MIFIHGGRATGKTVLLLKQSNRTGYPILVTNFCKAQFYLERAEQLGIQIPSPIIWTNNRLAVPIGTKVLIDDGEEVINHILLVNSGIKCDTMAISGPVKHLSHCFAEEIVGALPEELRGGKLSRLKLRCLQGSCEKGETDGNKEANDL